MVCHGDFHGVSLSVLISQETMLFHLADDVPNAFHGYVGKTCSKTIEDVVLIGIEKWGRVLTFLHVIADAECNVAIKFLVRHI